MHVDPLDFLTSDDGQSLLASLRAVVITEKNLLSVVSRLRKRYSREQASAAIELTQLRRKADAKFSRAHAMYFTRDALEQASGEVVASHRARRFATSASVLDLGCGIGGDTLQLARHADVIAIDRDTLRLRMAELNARAYAVEQRVRVVHGDFTQMPLVPADAIFLDPARRRTSGERVFSIHQYMPPLTILPQLLGYTPSVAVKISPGVNYDELASLNLDFELEFISESGTCKEGVLWFGNLRSGVVRRATILPDGVTLTSESETSRVPVEVVKSFLYAPDPAIVRAHLIEQLAARYGLAKLDEQIAYLTADELIDTPFARAFAVEESHPFNLKRLNERLRALDVGEVTIMKRGSAIDTDAFAKRLKLNGAQSKWLVLTRVQGKPFMLLCHPIASPLRNTFQRKALSPSPSL